MLLTAVTALTVATVWITCCCVGGAGGEVGLASKVERLRRCHTPLTIYSVLMVLTCWGR